MDRGALRICRCTVLAAAAWTHPASAELWPPEESGSRQPTPAASGRSGRSELAWTRSQYPTRGLEGYACYAPLPAGAAPGFAGAGLSSSTNVVATHVAVIVEFGCGLSFDLTSSPLMFTMRVNLPTRSKNRARL